MCPRSRSLQEAELDWGPGQRDFPAMLSSVGAHCPPPAPCSSLSPPTRLAQGLCRHGRPGSPPARRPSAGVGKPRLGEKLPVTPDEMTCSTTQCGGISGSHGTPGRRTLEAAPTILCRALRVATPVGGPRNCWPTTPQRGCAGLLKKQRKPPPTHPHMEVLRLSLPKLLWSFYREGN